MPEDIQVCQSAGCEQPVGILLQAAIAHLSEPEFELDHADHMLDTRTHPGLLAVPGALGPIHNTAVPVAPIGAAARLGSLLFDNLALALIRLVAPDIALLAMQQVTKHRTVMHIRRRRYHGMDDLGAAVHAKMRLHAEVPLVALLGLVHVRVTGLLLVLGETRRMNDRRIHNRAAGEPQGKHPL